MARIIGYCTACLLGGLLAASLHAADPIQATQAAKHIGETATVCGTVASSNYAAGSRGQPTFLNLDRPYPNYVFTAVIWGDSRNKFSTPPERAYDGQAICVHGNISSYRGKPQIEVSNPDQIMLQE